VADYLSFCVQFGAIKLTETIQWKNCPSYKTLSATTKYINIKLIILWKDSNTTTSESKNTQSTTIQFRTSIRRNFLMQKWKGTSKLSFV